MVPSRVYHSPNGAVEIIHVPVKNENGFKYHMQVNDCQISYLKQRFCCEHLVTFGGVRVGLVGFQNLMGIVIGN